MIPQSLNGPDLSAIPSKMKALILREPGHISFEEVDIPKLGDGDLLVRVRASTTCGTDLKAFRRGHPQIPMPGVFGHEYSGTVVASGDGAKFAVGTDVMGVHSAPCRDCYWCGRGQENLCETIMSSKVLGSFAEYIVIPKRIADLNVFEKPAQVPFDLASLLEPYSCVAQAIEEMKLGLGLPKGLHDDLRILIIGPGAIGLLFVAGLREIGVDNITLAGRNPGRLSVGQAFGAKTVTINDDFQPDSVGYDVVIECTGQVEVWQRSIDFVRRGGVLVLFGGCAAGTQVTFDTKRVHYDQISILSPFHFGTAAVARAREWIINPSVDLSLLLSGDRSLESGTEVFADLESGKGIKYVFRP